MVKNIKTDDNLDTLDTTDGDNNNDKNSGSKYTVLLIIFSVIIFGSLLLCIFFLKRTWRLHCSGIEKTAASIVKNGPKKSADLLVGLASTSNWHYSLICCVIPLAIYFTIAQLFPYPQSNNVTVDYVAIELGKALFLWCLMGFAISKSITFLQVHCINPVGGPSFT